MSLPALGMAGAWDLLRVLPGRRARGDTNPDQRRAAGLAARRVEDGGEDAVESRGWNLVLQIEHICVGI